MFISDSDSTGNGPRKEQFCPQSIRNSIRSIQCRRRSSTSSQNEREKKYLRRKVVLRQIRVNMGLFFTHQPHIFDLDSLRLILEIRFDQIYLLP